MKIKSQKDFWAGAMFLVTGLAFGLGALNYNFGSSARPGPAYFPFGLGMIQAVIGIVILFESLTIETEDGEPIGPWAWRPLLTTIGAIAIFALTLPRLGLVVSLPILIAVVSMPNRDVRLKDIVISSVVLTLASWLIFIYGLGLTIPVWPPFLTA